MTLKPKIEEADKHIDLTEITTFHKNQHQHVVALTLTTPFISLSSDLIALAFHPTSNPIIASTHTHTDPDSCVYTLSVCGNFLLTSAQTHKHHTKHSSGSIADHMDLCTQSVSKHT